MPKHGPKDGSRRQTAACSPRRLRASAKPTLVVVLPSPAAVGEMPVTSTSLPGFRPSSPFSADAESLALWWP